MQMVAEDLLVALLAEAERIRLSWGRLSDEDSMSMRSRHTYGVSGVGSTHSAICEVSVGLSSPGLYLAMLGKCSPSLRISGRIPRIS